MKKGVVRVFFRDNTFKSFNITEETTPSELCDLFAKKMRLSGKHFMLLEMTSTGSRIVNNDEKPLLLQQRHLLNGLPFGQSNKCGFTCSFREESAKSLREKIQTHREIFRNSFFEAPRKTWYDEFVNKTNSFSEKEKQLKGEQQLLMEFEGLKLSLQEEKKPTGRDRTQTDATSILTQKNYDSLNPASRRRTVSSPVISHKVKEEAPKPVLEWTVEEVCSWLKSNNLIEYQQDFKKEEIDGNALMALTENDLKDLGVKMGHRKKVLILLSNFEERKAVSEKLARVQESVAYVRADSNQDLDEIVTILSSVTSVDALADLDSVDVDSFLSLLAKQLEL